ncbi:hypothetical protein [Pseudofrankia inefficax]|uniref:hypothetical protein n=1 Tax=Pseudofrankia inefficax (strain DSM 45817 / CECT 9037 / DDB 130130 / EuI1c) TaxID=298654 RepID=UPI00059C3B92|nr:hypothetical protein [Pseudofrankia inefficax]
MPRSRVTPVTVTSPTGTRSTYSVHVPRGSMSRWRTPTARVRASAWAAARTAPSRPARRAITCMRADT